MKQEGTSLENIIQIQFSYAKLWWIIASVLRLSIVIINAAATFFSTYTIVFAFLAALLTMIQPLAQWYSDRIKGSADHLLRRIEMIRGLGWKLTAKEKSDIQATLSDRVKKKAASSHRRATSYFYSQDPPSPKQLLWNLEESAWTTKYQARAMRWYTGVFSGFIMFLAIIVLVVALQSAVAQTTANNIAKVTLSVIAFIFSGGYIRLSEEYHRLANAAERAENSASLLKNAPALSEGEALRVMFDYQIARSASPLLPDLLWKKKSRELNKLWTQRAKDE